jgi:hypothetical protein
LPDVDGEPELDDEAEEEDEEEDDEDNELGHPDWSASADAPPTTSCVMSASAVWVRLGVRGTNPPGSVAVDEEPLMARSCWSMSEMLVAVCVVSVFPQTAA